MLYTSRMAQSDACLIELKALLKSMSESRNLKINKSPGPDIFQAKLIKTMPPEQIRVLQKWLNEILEKEDLVTKVTEEETADRLALLHKGGSKSDQISHWRPVVLLNITNQLIAYVINERLTEMVEHMDILTQVQGGFRQNKSTDINVCKLYGLTKEFKIEVHHFLHFRVCKWSLEAFGKERFLVFPLEKYWLSQNDIILVRGSSSVAMR
jgi:hypothetical protein